MNAPVISDLHLVRWLGHTPAKLGSSTSFPFIIQQEVNLSQSLPAHPRRRKQLEKLACLMGSRKRWHVRSTRYRGKSEQWAALVEKRRGRGS